MFVRRWMWRVSCATKAQLNGLSQIIRRCDWIQLIFAIHATAQLIMTRMEKRDIISSYFPIKTGVFCKNREMKSTPYSALQITPTIVNNKETRSQHNLYSKVQKKTKEPYYLLNTIAKPDSVTNTGLMNECFWKKTDFNS